MQPLDQRVWRRHFTQLRPYVLRAFPQVDRERLEIAGDDFDAVVALVHRQAGLSPQDAAHQLRTLSIPEFGIGTGE